MAEKVGIEINLINAETALETIRNIEAGTRRLGAKRTTIRLEDGSLTTVEKRIKEIQDKLTAMKAAGKTEIFDHGQLVTAKKLNSELKILQRGLKDGTANAKTFKQTFNSISSAVAHAGSAMQSMGNALTRIGSFMRPITTGLLMGAGYKALNLFTEGFSNSFERADTMKNYDRTLKALGLDVAKTFSVAGKEAKTAKDNLDDAVQGLPTSLDEIMAAQKVYAGATGEMVESTKTAIAANNAFLASGMGAREQRFMQKYLVALASGAELTTTQWQSMARIAPLAMRAVSKELGYAEDEYAQFTKDVQKGTVSGEEFLKAFQKVGVSGVVADAARAQTESWNGLFSNIRIAVTRMGANVLDTLNQTFKDATGRTLLQRLLGWDAEGKDLQDGVKSWINGISDSVQKWVRANPDRIVEFFDNLKSIDFKGLFKGIAEGLGWVVTMIERFAKIAQGRDMTKVGRFLAKSGFIGRGMTIFGGIFKGLRHPLALIGAGGSWLLKGRFGGFFGKIAQIFGSKKSIKDAGDAAKAIPTVADTFRSAFKSLEGLMKIGGAITIAGGTAWFATTAVKGVLNDLKDIGEIISSGDIDWGSAAKAMAGFGAYLTAFVSAAYVIGDVAKLSGGVGGLTTLKTTAILGAISALAFGIADLDMFFIKDMFKKFKEVTDYLNQSIDNLRSLKKIKNIDDVKDRIGNVIDALQQVYASLKVQDEEGKSLMAASTQEINAMKDIISGMSTILGSVQTISDKMKTLASAKLISTKDALKVGKKIGGILEGLGEAFHSYLETDFGYNPTEMTAGLTATVENFNKALDTLTGENGLFTNLRKVQSDLRDIPGAQNITSVLSNVKSWMVDEGGLFSNLKEIVKGANGITNADTVETKMENFANAFVSIKKVFKQLKKIKKLTAEYTIGDIPGMGAVRNLIAQLKSAFDPNAVNQINSQVQSFVEQVSSLLETVEKINTKDGKITIKITLKDKIVGLDKVLKDIGGIDTKIKSAIDKIKTYYSKTITVSINTDSVVSGIPKTSSKVSDIAQDVLDRYKANGGPIYRSGGGSTPFKRRGTDTVPAMLTPGEYVHNKRAVSMFGIDFMRKVNNLDMKGAMNELMHRAGHMANINRGTNITNNYNNNQKVVINNSNAGAGYTFKAASRFVGAF